MPDGTAGNIKHVYDKFSHNCRLDENGDKIHTRVFALAEE
jgi:hypothetical protein